MLLLKDFLRLIRVEQWYKNLVIFIPLIFSLRFFELNSFLAIVAGFISLCFISSSSYIINDIFDKEKDRYHPKKKNIPISSGKVTPNKAFLFSAILFILSLIIAIQFSKYFTYSVLGLFVLQQIYTFFIRSMVFLDIIFISINFVIRAVSGIFIINEDISYWIILSTFFISVFLVSGKRFGCRF